MEKKPGRKPRGTMEELRKMVIATRLKIGEGVRAEDAAQSCGFRNAQAYYDAAYRLGMTRKREPAENDEKPILPEPHPNDSVELAGTVYKPYTPYMPDAAVPEPAGTDVPEDVDELFPVGTREPVPKPPRPVPKLRATRLEGQLLAYEITSAREVRLAELANGLVLSQPIRPADLLLLADELRAVYDALSTKGELL